jgi:hypothetical protein
MACRDALSVQRFNSNDFKRGINDELANQNRPRIDFGSGIWQLVGTRTLQNRNKYTHSGVQIADRFPPLSHAEEAVADVRDAVRDIYARVGKVPPAWIESDSSSGWPRQGGGMMGTPTMTRQGADPNNPGTIKITLIFPDGREQPVEYLPSDTPEETILGVVEDILGKLNSSFTGIRVYRGATLLHDESIEVRG